MLSMSQMFTGEAGGLQKSRYFSHDLNVVKARYFKARNIFSKILQETGRKNNQKANFAN